MFGSEISYSVFPYRKNNYVGRISGAIYDAFALGTPVIAFDIPCFSQYFQEYGDIGYLVQTVDEMEQIIANIIESNPWERYVEQQRSIRVARQDLNCLNYSQETNKELLWM